MHRVPDKNPGSDSDTVCLKRDWVRTCHESDPIYIVSCSDTSCWLPEESRDRVGRSLEPDPTRTSSHPGQYQVNLALKGIGVGLNLRMTRPFKSRDPSQKILIPRSIGRIGTGV